MKKFLVIIGILLAISFADLRAMRPGRFRRSFQAVEGRTARDTRVRQPARRERGYMSAGLCARQHGDFEQYLIEQTGEKTIRQQDEKLSAAVRENQVERVRELLNKGGRTDLAYSDHFRGTVVQGESLLEFATHSGQQEVVVLLLEHGAGADDAINRLGAVDRNTLLYRAVAKWGYPLPEHVEGISPEQIAEKDTKLAACLLKHKAQVDKMGADKLTPLQKALWKLVDIDLISLLVGYGASMKVVNQDSVLLSHVAQKATRPVIRLLVLSGVHFNQLAPGRQLSPFQEASPETQQEMSAAQELKNYCDVVTRLPKFLGYLPRVLQRIVADYYIEQEIAAELERRAAIKLRS